MLAAGLLAGCGTGETGLQRDAATQLQARVLEVTQASSQNDPATALRALEGLETELENAQSKGGISEERRRSITTIAAAVRADLTDAIANANAEQAKARAAEEARQAAEQAAPQSPPAQEAPAPTTLQPSGEGAGKKENPGKGKGSG